MKTLRFAMAIASLAWATMAVTALPAVTPQAEQQTLTITATLKSDNPKASGDLLTTLKAGKISGVSFKERNRQVRHRMFAIIDRTQASASAVACEAKDAEYGNVRLEDGSWIGVVVCPKSASVAPIRVPELVKAMASAANATGKMDCWENKDLSMGVCYKLAANPQPTRSLLNIPIGQPGVPQVPVPQ